MKTADLIPLILLELNENDKYGFELTKNIETKSGGKIVIKQPTLYTVLKKLEKSKFISSYWQDSEIGGKRHYYKITEFGKMQVSTLPSYDILIQSATEDEDSVQIQENVKTDIQSDPISTSLEPLETVMPTEEVFAETSLDTATETDINMANSQILKEEKITEEEQFAENKDVVKFTENLPANTAFTVNESAIQPPQTIYEQLDSHIVHPQPIKYVDYINLKKDKKHILEKSITKKSILKSISTSLSILAVLILCSLITLKTGTSTLYFITLISFVLVIIFYPLLTALNIDKFVKKHSNNFDVNLKRQSLITASLVLVVLIIALIVNIGINNNSFIKIFSFSNFENFYAPIIITSSLFFDVLFSYLFLKNIKK